MSVLFPLALEAVSLTSTLAVMLQEQQQTGGDTESQGLCCTCTGLAKPHCLPASPLNAGKGRPLPGILMAL